MILDVVDSALPNGIPDGISEDQKLLEMCFIKLLNYFRSYGYKQVIWMKLCWHIKGTNRFMEFDSQRLASIQKDLAATLLFGGVEVEVPAQFQVWSPTALKSNLRKQFSVVCTHEQNAKCAAGQNDTALNLVKKISGCSEANQEPHVPSLLLGAKLLINFGVCYGNAARVSLSDFERNFCQREALAALNSAVADCKEDPEILYNLDWKCHPKKLDSALIILKAVPSTFTVTAQASHRDIQDSIGFDSSAKESMTDDEVISEKIRS
ncbi:hypothetical protein HAX54_038034 [Datura stramonium]|uniref:Uncharacterized protein n=1 Tax=Datura stramonium TaxID=4076 RepID=A0ABS8SHT4_DATST|nr:hypothetical protein [Datura stramonium]